MIQNASTVISRHKIAIGQLNIFHRFIACIIH